MLQEAKAEPEFTTKHKNNPLSQEDNQHSTAKAEKEIKDPFFIKHDVKGNCCVQMGKISISISV